MPGHERIQGERIEQDWQQDWQRQGYEEGRAGLPCEGPSEYMAMVAAGMGLDTRGAYLRGYNAGRESVGLFPLERQ